MTVAGIIAEYNPFHNGHLHHIAQTREMYGATHVAVALGGNFTQRGDAAFITKQARTRAALMYGADLVAEIPAAFSASAADIFAYGGVYILDALGCDLLSFGSECGDLPLLTAAADAVTLARESDLFRGGRGASYPAALSRAVRDLRGDSVADVLSGANNTLAVEYIRAAACISSAVVPVTVKRGGAAHDGTVVSHDGTASAGEFISAMELRRHMRGGSSENFGNFENTAQFRPAYDVGVTADIRRLETAILVHLRRAAAVEIQRAPRVTADMANRIKNAVREGRTTDEVLRLAKTKAYTMSGLRRAVLSAFLGITASDAARPPQYVRVLGMNARGREILHRVNSALPVNTSLAALAKTSEAAAAQAYLENSVGDVYAAALEIPAPCGSEFTEKPVII